MEYLLQPSECSLRHTFSGVAWDKALCLTALWKIIMDDATLLDIEEDEPAQLEALPQKRSYAGELTTSSLPLLCLASSSLTAHIFGGLLKGLVH